MECPICLTRYDNTTRPVVGSCGHSLCSNCAGNVDSCPTCRVNRAFEQPPTNYLATELVEQCSSWSLKNSDQEHQIQEANSKIMELSKELDDELAKINALDRHYNNITRERDDLKRDLLAAQEGLERHLKLVDHYREKLATSENERKLLQQQGQQLRQHIEHLLHQEGEREERTEWDLCEDKDFPQPHKVVMKVPQTSYISDETKKQLKNATAAMVINANHQARILLAASKQQLETNVVPTLQELGCRLKETISTWMGGQ